MSINVSSNIMHTRQLFVQVMARFRTSRFVSFEGVINIKKNNET